MYNFSGLKLTCNQQWAMENLFSIVFTLGLWLLYKKYFQNFKYLETKVFSLKSQCRENKHKINGNSEKLSAQFYKTEYI